jgi:hypothetical protein
MAGLLNLVPRFLPRYGMAPEWASATRPLVLVFTAIAFAVTLAFHADVDAQGGAYATGVLVLISSAAVATTLSVWHARRRGATLAFGAIALVFAYTTVVNVIERPEGIKIGAMFIVAIVGTSLVSRVWRSTELRVASVEVDRAALRFIQDASRDVVRIIAHDPEQRDAVEYHRKLREQQESSGIPPEAPVLFLEVTVSDPSEFAPVLKVRGEEVEGYRVLRAESATVPNAIAAFLLYVRDMTNQIPHAYFGWSEGPPLVELARYLISGEGDVPPVTHEVLREAEPDPTRRPRIHVG